MGNESNGVENKPLSNQRIRPLVLVAHIDSHRNYVSANQISGLAIKIYKTKDGKGMTYQDLMDAGLVSHKKQAQRILKYHLARETLFTLRDTRPQQYYSSTIRSEVIKKDLQKNGPLEPTGVALSNIPLPCSIINSKNNNTNSTSDLLVIQSLEGYVLPLLPSAPLYIHNIQLKLRLTPECYNELDLPMGRRNKGKEHTDIIGQSRVCYCFYANGTVIVYVENSNNPIKLEDDTDRSRLMVFFGQIRDRLVTFLMDRHERIVPDILGWELTQCDINKDIKVGEALHYTGIKVQVKHVDHLFRIYIKSIGKDTVCRVEESVSCPKGSSAVEAINSALNPHEHIENLIGDMIDRKLGEKICSTNDRKGDSVASGNVQQDGRSQV
jgi:hypothetical protein